MKVTIDREKAALQIAEMLDAIYMSGRDAQDYTIRIGIWDEHAVPYTFYAIVTIDDMPVAGENSYGAETLEQAVLELHQSFFEYLADLDVEVTQ